MRTLCPSHALIFQIYLKQSVHENGRNPPTNTEKQRDVVSLNQMTDSHRANLIMHVCSVSSPNAQICQVTSTRGSRADQSLGPIIKNSNNFLGWLTAKKVTRAGNGLLRQTEIVSKSKNEGMLFNDLSEHPLPEPPSSTKTNISDLLTEGVVEGLKTDSSEESSQN